MTAFSILAPRKASASRLTFWSRNAESCCGVYSFPSGVRYLWSVPIFRLKAMKVDCGLATAWRRAGSPTSSWPSLAKAT